MGLPVVTNQTINNFYDRYCENEIMFTKETLRSLHVDPRRVFIKIAGEQWPCIINSSSLKMAKIIIGTTGQAYKILSKQDAPPVSLYYSFREQDGQLLNFFVIGKVTSIEPYMRSSELAVITITFTARPNDSLILKIGSLIDANEAFTKRKENRIILNDFSQKKLGLEKRESIVTLNKITQRCILWDISFSGTKIIIQGEKESVIGKNISIRYFFEEPEEVIDVEGIVINATEVESRPGILSASIKFNEETIPLAYKLRINEYLTHNRVQFLEKNGQ